jgi:phage protein D
MGNTFIGDVLEITVENSLHLSDVATIVLYDKDLTWVEDSSLMPGNTLQIVFSDGKQQQSVFDGEIVEIESNFDQGVLRFTIRAFDRMHRLSRGRHVRSFINVSDSDIIKKLAAEVQLSAQVDATPLVYPYVFQNNESNLSFLQKRAAALGYLLYVQGKTLYCKAPQSNGSTVTLAWGKELYEFHPRMTTIAQVANIEAHGWNPLEKQMVMGRASSGSGIGAPQATQNSNGGAFAQQAFHLSQVQELIADRPIRSSTLADQLAKAEANRQAGRFIEAEGTCIGNPKLVAGTSVTITNAGRRFSGTYFVTNTVHTYSARHGYTTQFSSSGLQPTLLLSLLTQKESEGQEAITGPVIALVTDNQDPEGLGRVKVKYPWLANDQASDWARIVAPGGGAQRGIEFLPEVNDEVLVGFEMGDIHYPYVLGGLWNGQDAPPDANVTIGGAVQKRLIRSRTGHTITLDDSEEGGGITIEDKNGNKIMLDCTTNNLSITVNGNANIQAQGDLSLQATGRLQLSGDGGVAIDGGAANTEIKGLNVNIKGALINLN